MTAILLYLDTDTEWTIIKKDKGKDVSLEEDRTESYGSRSSELPRFQYSQHMKVVRLSAMGTRRLHLPVDINGTHFC